jgi:hypothetical protein
VSLVVSLKIPDGVVIAADSLSTVQGQIAIEAHLKTDCPKCGEKIELENLAPLQMPTALSTSSFAQKLFPFCGKYGIGAYGLSVLLGRTVGYLIEALENEVKSSEIKGVTHLAGMIQERFDNLVRQQFQDIDKAPDSFSPLGFHVVGYDEDDGKIMEVKVGKKSAAIQHVDPGCTASGANQVVTKLWELGQKDQSQRINFAVFSLQDAIDYADYLINTTASHQRFAMMIPAVGGQVDIALVTPFRGFAWIRRKRLSRVLSGGADEHAEHITE